MWLEASGPISGAAGLFYDFGELTLDLTFAAAAMLSELAALKLFSEPGCGPFAARPPAGL